MSKAEVLNAGLALSPEERVAVADRLFDSVLPHDINKTEVRTELAVRLFDKEALTLGQAAQLAGLSKRQFLELIAEKQVSVARYSVEELERESRL